MSNRSSVALAAALLVGASSVVEAFPSRFLNRMVAHSGYRADYGGNVFDYYSSARSADRGARKTVIAGVCASACTMKLGIRNVCIERNAQLLFHQASYAGLRSELGTRLMLSAYPPRIRQWVLRRGALNGSGLTVLSGQEAIALGVRPC